MCSLSLIGVIVSIGMNFRLAGDDVLDANTIIPALFPVSFYRIEVFISVGSLICLACLFFFIPLQLLVFVQIKNFTSGKTTNERFARRSVVDESELDMSESMLSMRPPKGSMIVSNPPCGDCACGNNCWKMCCQHKMRDQSMLFDKHITDNFLDSSIPPVIAQIAQE